jgi:hypothetical protein
VADRLAPVTTGDRRGERAMKWVTRERPVIDRIACPWLIARFIDRSPSSFSFPRPT